MSPLAILGFLTVIIMLVLIMTELSLPENLRTAPAAQPLTLAQRTRAFEKQEILRLLACNGSHLEGKKKTAAQLGISLASLYNKLNGSF